MRSRFAGEPVTVIRAGVSDAPGKLVGVTYYNTWTIAPVGSLSGRIASPSPGAQAIEGSEPFDVDLTTLDALVETLQLNDLAFVKIDVDGYEPQVLRGGKSTLKKLRPDVLLELSYIPQDMGEPNESFITSIYDSGYVLATFAGQVASAQQVLEHFPNHTSFDMLMVPVDRYPDWSHL
jgi:FkbM family methyltransferase